MDRVSVVEAELCRGLDPPIEVDGEMFQVAGRNGSRGSPWYQGSRSVGGGSVLGAA